MSDKTPPADDVADVVPALDAVDGTPDVGDDVIVLEGLTLDKIDDLRRQGLISHAQRLELLELLATAPAADVVVLEAGK